MACQRGVSNVKRRSSSGEICMCDDESAREGGAGLAKFDTEREAHAAVE